VRSGAGGPNRLPGVCARVLFKPPRGGGQPGTHPKVVRDTPAPGDAKIGPFFPPAKKNTKIIFFFSGRNQPPVQSGGGVSDLIKNLM